MYCHGKKCCHGQKDDRVGIEHLLVHFLTLEVVHEFYCKLELEKYLIDPFDWRKLRTHFSNLEDSSEATQINFDFRFVCVVTLSFFRAQDKPNGVV